ncbi:uncharacterized protein LOC125177782, partial [Hyalella azteca]|uniref:Uncharacterized protein LOC125177782 n=1 Tax=Hyalella azteca TaxID=294128 RepID=A0A979FIK0_HYAAZ
MTPSAIHLHAVSVAALLLILVVYCYAPTKRWLEMGIIRTLPKTNEKPSRHEEVNTTFPRAIAHIGRSQKIIIIWTQPRSGSSFTTDLISKIPHSFVLFEPISSRIRYKFHQKPVTNITEYQSLEMVVHCKFDFSMTFIDDLDHDFCFIVKNLSQASCNTPEFLAENCRCSRVLLLKVVTPRLVLAERLLAEYPHLNIKIIHLIRDPRAIIASARRMPWGKSIRLKDENILCSNLRSDMKTGDVIERTHPN